MNAVYRYFPWAILTILAIYFLLTPETEALTQQPLFEGLKKVIVLDPGHGGDDPGAAGPDGTTEKAVALKTAQMIATELGREYKVVLTRTDDYRVDIENRPAVANHQKADLFISLHTGGSFVHSTAGVTIFFYQNESDPYLTRQESILPPGRDPQAPIPWDRVQDQYLEDSRILAKIIKAQIDKLNSIKQCSLEGAPLVVLKSANMPAILIELGYLTNPAEEKNLRNADYLRKIAREISIGIEEFFAQKQ